MAIAKATALEMMSEPLSLLVLIGALALSTFAPAFHYHQFGEATRMARDAGVSALLVAGTAFALFGTVRTFRRELESGTAAVAMAISVSRSGFFLAKTFGALLAYAVFALAVVGNSLAITNGAAIGGALAEATGDLPRLWGPCYALGVAAVIAPVVTAAVLNRFWRFRFCLSAFVLTVAIAVGSSGYRFDVALARRLVAVWVPLAAVPAVVLAAAAAAAVRFRANVATGFVSVFILLALPFVGNHCLADALSKGGTVGWTYALAATVVAALAAGSLLFVGMSFVNARDVS